MILIKIKVLEIMFSIPIVWSLLIKVSLILIDDKKEGSLEDFIKKVWLKLIRFSHLKMKRCWNMKTTLK